MTFEIRVRVSDRHKNVAELNQLMGHVWIRIHACNKSDWIHVADGV